jgi:hypothetical protein
MLGCYLMVMGKNFDVDSFLRDSPFDPEAIYHRGKRWAWPGGTKMNVFSSSGFSVTVGKIFGKLPPQVRVSTRFLERHRRELMRLKKYPGVTFIRLVLIYCPGNVANTCEVLPHRLLALAGTYGITLQLSVYPGEIETRTSVEKAQLRRHMTAMSQRPARKSPSFVHKPR